MISVMIKLAGHDFLKADCTLLTSRCIIRQEESIFMLDCHGLILKDTKILVIYNYCALKFRQPYIDGAVTTSTRDYPEHTQRYTIWICTKFENFT